MKFISAKYFFLAICGFLACNIVVEALKLVEPARAASVKRYKVVSYDLQNAEAILNRYAQDGWELSLIEPKSGAFILEKD